MTNSAAAAVLDRIESDEAFGQRLKEAGGPEASIELLKAEGFDVTPSDMRDAVLDRYGDQLTSEQVDALAAGFDERTAAGVIAGVAATAFALAAAV